MKSIICNKKHIILYQFLLKLYAICFNLKTKSFTNSGNTIPYQIYVTNSNHNTSHKYGFMSSGYTLCEIYKDMIDNLSYYYHLKKRK
jgi:hypothetical protein